MNRCLTLVVGCCLLPAAARGNDPSFERDVLPILNSHCLQCHGGLHQKGKLDLRTLAVALAGGKSGPAVVAGDLEKSPLWKRIESDEMPPRAIKVSAEQKQTIVRWIQSGAKSVVQTAEVPIPEKAKSDRELAEFIDREIDKKLAAEKLPMSPQADDGEFLRRIYLDVHGRIPTQAQTLAFLDSDDPARREKLIDALIADPLFGHYFARQWRDRIAVPVVAGGDLNSSHTAAFYKWLTEAINANRPWDAVVREIIVAEGDSPALAFIRQSIDDGQPRAAKLTSSLTRRFLGVQMQCAECHDHPFTTWKQDDFWGLAAFFSRTARVEKTKNDPRTGIFDTKEGPKRTRFGLEPLVRKEAGAVAIPKDAGPHAGKIVPAKFLTGEVVKLDDEASPRPRLAEWTTSPKNPYFARAAVNRIWGHLMGRGLVEPIDALDESLPSHPELFHALAGDFIASGFDVKHIVRSILLTRAYQRSHRVVAGNEKDDVYYSHATVKVVPPESFYECLVIASGGVGKDGTAGTIAAGGRSSKGEILGSRAEFMKLFGTDEIDGDPVDYTQGIPQALVLMNERATNETARLVDDAIREKGDDDAIVTRIFVGVLCRRPSDEERSIVREFLDRRPEDPMRFQAVWWALVNSPEFAVIP